GRAMTDDYLLHTLYVKVGNEYFVRNYDGTTINVLWLGLKNDYSQYNEVILNNFIQKLPFNVPLVLFFPAGDYKFKKLPPAFDVSLPANGAVTVKPTAIRLHGLEMTLLGERGTNLIIDAGSSGISMLIGHTTLRNLNISAAAKDSNDGKINGNWSTNAGDYIHCGVNVFGQVTWESVNVGGFSGNGVFLYGDPTTYISFPPREIKGYKHAAYFDFAEPADRYYMKHESTITINGITVTVSGFQGTGPGSRVVVNTTTAFDSIPDGNYTAIVNTPGPGLIADNSQFYGENNFDSNNGCGMYIAGADGNQTTLIGVSVRENGFWGILDNSFLGTHVFGAHGSANGKNFRDPNGTHADTPYGAFATVNVNARSTWIGCYTEQGNQGKDFYEVQTVIMGGIHAAGMNDGAYFIQPGRIPPTTFSTINIENGVLFTLNGTQYKLGFRNDNEIQVTPNTFGIRKRYAIYSGESGFFDFYPDGHIGIRNLEAETMKIDNREFGHAIQSLANLASITTLIKAGTFFPNKNANGKNPSGWTCIQTGKIAPTGNAANANGNGPTINMQTVNHGFTVGEQVLFHGVVYTLTATAGADGFYVDPYPSANPGPVTAIAAAFKPLDTGIGLLSERPAASADLKGFLFYATDTKVTYHCDGTAWS
ncbi:MAG TPA: hypothetical protein VFR70_00020, partial [Flavobacterium sp.]|nr:hypothetical protein [Flavobacterium sp.]